MIKPQLYSDSLNIKWTSLQRTGDTLSISAST